MNKNQLILDFRNNQYLLNYFFLFDSQYRILIARPWILLFTSIVFLESDLFQIQVRFHHYDKSDA